MAVESRQLASKKQKRVISLGDGIEVRAVDLFVMDVEQHPNVMLEAKDEKPTHAIAAVINSVTFNEDSCLGYVDFRVTRKYGENEAQNVYASYFIFLESETSVPIGDWKKAIQSVAKSAAWLRFADLFSLVRAQISIDFPPLPSTPPSIMVDGDPE